MTRLEVQSTYEVRDGRIVSPGQFEGEAIYLPHFWSIYLDGFADRDDGKFLGFDVTAEDRAEFPELEGRHTVTLFQADSGFVCEVTP